MQNIAETLVICNFFENFEKQHSNIMSGYGQTNKLEDLYTNHKNDNLVLLQISNYFKRI